jgi:hypothetical protein
LCSATRPALNFELVMWSGVRLETLLVPQLAKQFLSFHRTLRSVTVFTKTRHWFHLSQMNPVCVLPLRRLYWYVL